MLKSWLFDNLQASEGNADDNWKLGMESHFRNTIHSNMPWQLGDGFRSSLFNFDVETGPQTSTFSKQMLCRHPQYRDAILIRDPLHCFHRSDG